MDPFLEVPVILSLMVISPYILCLQRWQCEIFMFQRRPESRSLPADFLLLLHIGLLYIFLSMLLNNWVIFFQDKKKKYKTPLILVEWLVTAVRYNPASRVPASALSKLQADNQSVHLMVCVLDAHVLAIEPFLRIQKILVQNQEICTRKNPLFNMEEVLDLDSPESFESASLS